MDEQHVGLRAQAQIVDDGTLNRGFGRRAAHGTLFGTVQCSISLPEHKSSVARAASGVIGKSALEPGRRQKSHRASAASVAGHAPFCTRQPAALSLATILSIAFMVAGVSKGSSSICSPPS